MEKGDGGNRAAISYRIAVPWHMYVLIAVLGLITICLVAYGFHRGIVMAVRRSPRVDALMEIKLEATAARFHLEVEASRQSSEELDVVWLHLDQADWYVNALLVGGSGPQGTFLAVRNPVIRVEIQQLQKYLLELRAASQERLAAADENQMLEAARQRYLAAFDAVIEQADVLESQLKNILAEDLHRFYLTQWFLFVLCTALWIIVGLAFRIFTRRQAIANAAVNAANETLIREIAERKLAEESLEKEHQRLIRLLDAMPYCIYIVNDKYDIEYANPAMEREFGPINDRKCYEYLNDRNVECPWCKIPQHLAGETPQWQWHSPKNNKDYELFATSVKNIDGSSSRFLVFHDITGRREAEEALREHERKFRTLFNKAADAIFLHDRQGHFLDANQRACELLGYTHQELMEKTVADIDPNAARVDRIKSFWEKSDVAEFPLFESWHVRKDGSSFPVEIRLGAIDSPQGRLIMAVVRDISERKRSEEQLQRERDFSAQIINSLPGLFYVFDEKRFVDWNPKWEEVTGYSAEALGRMYGPDLFAGDEKELIAERMQEVFRTGSSTAEASVVTKDGRRIPYFFTGARCIFDGKPHLVGLGIDITVLKTIEAEREKLITELEEQNAELERFTYTVSHDLKSPLITIKGFLGMLIDDMACGNKEAVEHEIERISGAADKMSLLLSDLLELSRIGRLVNPPEDVPLGEVAAEAVELNSGRIEKIGASVSISPELPVVRADRRRLVEVMQNLVDNALKYMGEQKHPKVEIGVRNDSKCPIYFVRDNGIGIDHNYADKIFGLFEKLDPKSEGTGIGLALARRIIEVHDGRIWVESKGQGHGATFCFTLPEKNKPHKM